MIPEMGKISCCLWYNETTMSDDLSTQTFNEPAESLTPRTILGEKYELLEQIGRGGMGVVWKANDKVADRLVALKFVPRELNRFETEMQRVRETFKKVHALQHQAICPIYTLEDGGHLGYYLVMKYLEGETLDSYVQRKSAQSAVLPLNQVVALLSRVAAALDYAHQEGVIHRDIKPSNIFLVKSGGKLHVQVIDFGLADEIRTSMIRTSQAQIEISGTRPYMAPEQWRGRPQSAATDQYALAVVAYELLAGELPFKGGDVTMLRLAVMNDMPEPIATLSNSTNDVLRKALAKDAADRFATCRQFIAALNNVWSSVEDAPEEEEEARTASIALASLTFPSLSRHFWSRFNSPHLGWMLVILVILTIAAWSKHWQFYSDYPDIWSAVQAGTDQDVRYFIKRGADINLVDNRNTLLHLAARQNQNPKVVRYLVSKKIDVNTQNAMGETPLHLAASFNPNTEVLRYLISVRNVDINAKDNNGRTPLSVASTEEKQTILRDAGGVGGRITTTPSQMGQTTVTQTTGATTLAPRPSPPSKFGNEQHLPFIELKGHTESVLAVTFSPDGKKIVTGSEDSTVRIWNTESGKELRKMVGLGGIVYSVAFSPDGKKIVTGSGHKDSSVRIWDAELGRELKNFKTGYAFSVAFSPDGKRIVTGGVPIASTWDAVSGRQLLALRGHTDAVVSVVFSPDGTKVASGGWDRTLRIWDTESGRELRALQGHTGSVRSVAFSPDGKHVVSGGMDETVRIWNVESGKILRRLEGHTGDVNSVAFSPDGKKVASGSGDSTTRIWNVSTLP